MRRYKEVLTGRVSPSLSDSNAAFVHPERKLTMRELYARLLASSPTLTPPVPLLPVNKAAPWPLGSKTFIMGILNVTPDSFSDGADNATVETAVARALAMERAGVDIVDIGGESTRPGATPVSEAEELQRVLPVIAGIRAQSALPISIDTTKAAVARAAVAAGANIVNDVSAGRQDAHMFAVVAELRVPVRVCHLSAVGCFVADYRNGPSRLSSCTCAGLRRR